MSNLPEDPSQGANGSSSNDRWPIERHQRNPELDADFFILVNMGRQIEVSNRDIHLQHRAFLQAALSTRLVRVDGAPAFIYTSISSPDHIVVTVTEVTGEFGGLLVPDGEIELGSWFRRFRIKRSTGEKINEIAAKAGRAAELQYIDSPRSQNDEREANAVSNLIQSLETTDEAIIRLSSILLIKVDGRVIAQVLTPEQIDQLDRSPDLLKHPKSILDALSGKGNSLSLDGAPLLDQPEERRQLG